MVRVAVDQSRARARADARSPGRDGGWPQEAQRRGGDRIRHALHHGGRELQRFDSRGFGRDARPRCARRPCRRRFSWTGASRTLRESGPALRHRRSAPRERRRHRDALAGGADRVARRRRSRRAACSCGRRSASRCSSAGACGPSSARATSRSSCCEEVSGTSSVGSKRARGAPVVLEFAGPSARLLSVGERSVMAALAPQVGAAAALFVSDERTEVFLRDQRRSKAHRALAPDAGAPCEEVVNVDLGAVDPLLLDEQGQVRAVRDLAGQPVSQALLGGDGGVTLRDLFAAAILAEEQARPLAARLPSGDAVAADARGARRAPAPSRISSRPGRASSSPTPASSPGSCTAPCLGGGDAYMRPGAAHRRPPLSRRRIGGDARVRRRDGRGRGSAGLQATGARHRAARACPRTTFSSPESGAGRGRRQAARGREADAAPHEGASWRAAQTLDLVEGAALALSEARQHARAQDPMANGGNRVAVVCATLDEVRDLAARAFEIAPAVGAVLAPYIPSGLVALLSAAGIAAIASTPRRRRGSKGNGRSRCPRPRQWAERAATTMAVGPAKLPLTWLALGAERAWATGGPTETAGAKDPPSRRSSADVDLPRDRHPRVSGILSSACRRASSLGKSSAGC